MTETELTTATDFELVEATCDAWGSGRKDIEGASVERWTKKGDRLYVNGVSQLEKHDIYFDVESVEMCGFPSRHYEVDIDVSDGEIVVRIVNDHGPSTHDYELVIEYDDEDESTNDDNDDDDQQDDESGDGWSLDDRLDEVTSDDYSIDDDDDEEPEIMTDGGPKGDTRENGECPNCGESGRKNWIRADTLPQIGQVYECESCGQECHLYDNSERGRGESYAWVPVDTGMRRYLGFIDVVGAPPDQALGELYKRGLERVEAIDYHVVENKDLSQSEWAERTRRSQPTVSENVAKAREKLGEIATDGGVEPLTATDYVAAADVSRLLDIDNNDYAVIKRDSDQFGHVLDGILFDGENYAFASRRDDSRVETDDGSRLPHWKVKQAGEKVEITDASELEDAYADSDDAEFILDDPERSAHEFVTDAVGDRFSGHGRTGWDIEDVNNGSMTLYDPNECCRFTVDFEFVTSES